MSKYHHWEKWMTFFRDDNDPSKKYKNNFVLSDAIGKLEVNDCLIRDNLSENAEG